MADKIRVLLPEEDVNKRISEVAEQISKDYEGKEIHLICILKGGVFFTCELAKRLTVPVSMDFMSVSSYGAGTVSSGVVKIIKDLDEPLEGKDVLIVEDIIDSGRTLAYLIEILKQRGPKSIHLCTLLDKPERRVKKQVHVDYTCFTIPDEFVEWQSGVRDHYEGARVCPAVKSGDICWRICRDWKRCDCSSYCRYAGSSRGRRLYTSYQ